MQILNAITHKCWYLGKTIEILRNLNRNFWSPVTHCVQDNRLHHFNSSSEETHLNRSEVTAVCFQEICTCAYGFFHLFIRLFFLFCLTNPYIILCSFAMFANASSVVLTSPQLSQSWQLSQWAAGILGGVSFGRGPSMKVPHPSPLSKTSLFL